ncbi:Zinc phosphodiesterase ELAC protein 1 [Grifola frondosa]|uniref:Zinc phosphodiesterase ELAC protein 1 n=1 Tax=Grifola frondosa TaxID=5627 RepID=A0A1C7M023_GRIFR|nr:Zinc phosphodiesterase ELAC protein 1 [Grifola frondosa]
MAPTSLSSVNITILAPDTEECCEDGPNSEDFPDTYARRPYLRAAACPRQSFECAGGTVEGVEDPRGRTQEDIQVSTLSSHMKNRSQIMQEPLEIYGPLGTRAYIRNGLKYTYTLLGAPYVVHELRFLSDSLSGDYTALPCHASELSSGRNIPQINGIWPDIYKYALVTISAAPILHSVPCVGYVITELPIPGKMDPRKYIPEIKRTKTPMSVMSVCSKASPYALRRHSVAWPIASTWRKIVILGDTYDPTLSLTWQWTRTY